MKSKKVHAAPVPLSRTAGSGTLDFHSRTRVVFGPGCLSRLNEFVKAKRVLLVIDPALAHLTETVEKLLAKSKVHAFSDVSPNPHSAAIERGRAFAEPVGPDFIIGLGGGSAMDTAKAINFVLTNGGVIQDYWGYGKAKKKMLPSLGVPTTAGTGSEAQSYCLISDALTHRKMACGDPKSTFQTALLDPELTLTQPPSVTAAAGYDAISHAVESFVCTKSNFISRMFAIEAFRLMEPSFERVLTTPDNIEARGNMLMGAHLAGLSIENSMLGAAHACANPLTAWFGTTHGVAIALMLPHVVRFNQSHADYGNLYPNSIAERLTYLAQAAGMPRNLENAGVSAGTLSLLASDAAEQWTGKFNPRPFNQAAALEIYRCAYSA